MVDLIDDHSTDTINIQQLLEINDNGTILGFAKLWDEYHFVLFKVR
ncbi:MAG: hypothetical protein WC222_08800 [Parachlamydiales bacterium]